MRIGVGCDHAGFPHKIPLVAALEADGHAVTDFGTDSTDAVDYPDFAHTVGAAVREDRVDAGILICGSGAGVSIAANKLRGVRAALAHDAFTARQAREDDDANVLCVGARVVDADTAIALARVFLGARFTGASRHQRRLAKIAALEAAECGAAATDAADGPGAEAVTRLERRDAGAR